MQHLDSRLLEYCENLGSIFWENVELLKNFPEKDELSEYLYNWAIVLGVLALDNFETVVFLLNTNKIRGANMAARSITDYAVRLRYYIVQGANPRRGFQGNPTVPLNHFKKEIHAAKDWDNADLNLISILNLYDETDWSDAQKEYIDKLIDGGEKASERSFSDMLDHLRNHECRELGIISFFQDKVERTYRNMKPHWKMQSAFSHGAQAVITDVIEYKNGEKTGHVFRHSPVDASKTILFTTINHMIHLINSFAILHGWAYGPVKLRNEAAELWLSIEKDKLP